MTFPVIPTITGNLFAVGSIFGKGNSTITGTSNQGVNALTLPVLPDKSYYQSLADESISPKGIYKLSGEINKIIFIDGDVMLKGDLSGTGTIIATGDIKVINAKNTDKLSLISYSDIKLDGSINFTALCYAAGSIKVDATGNFSGSLVADSIKIAGNTTLFYKPLLVEGLLDKMEEAFEIGDQETTFKVAGVMVQYGSYATPFLREIFTNKEKMRKMRFLISEIMVVIKDLDFIPPLIAVLSDVSDHENVREHAAQSLGMLGDKRALDTLRYVLNDTSEIVRSRASLALGMLGDKSAVNDLIVVLQNKEKYGYYAQINAAKSLGMIKDSSAVPQLIGALQDEDEVVRMHVAKSLGDIKDVSAVDSLILLLQEDESAYVRSQVAEALGKVGGDKAFNALVQALEGKDEFVRINIALALAEIGDKRALPFLKAILLETEDSFTKQKIEEAIEKLGNE